MDVGVGKEKIDCFICYFFFLENFRSCFPFCINHILASLLSFSPLKRSISPRILLEKGKLY